MAQAPFWREGIEAAVSLSFDDARLSQADLALPLLREYAARATFYIEITQAQQRLEAWQQAVRDGHEIGNHTVNHPCSINHPWAKHHLENYTLDMMEWELVEANRLIEQTLGVRPTTFAYPCGQTFVGRGVNRQSYVPLVARYFDVGRGYLWTTDAAPQQCDLACVPTRELDCCSWPQAQQWLDHARKHHRWLIFVAHEVGHEDRRQTAQLDVLRRLCEYCLDSRHGIWLDTVAAVGRSIAQSRSDSASCSEASVHSSPS